MSLIDVDATYRLLSPGGLALILTMIIVVFALSLYQGITNRNRGHWYPGHENLFNRQRFRALCLRRTDVELGMDS
jgi:hypothetical protein